MQQHEDLLPQRNEHPDAGASASKVPEVLPLPEVVFCRVLHEDSNYVYIYIYIYIYIY